MVTSKPKPTTQFRQQPRGGNPSRPVSSEGVRRKSPPTGRRTPERQNGRSDMGKAAGLVPSNRLACFPRKNKKVSAQKLLGTCDQEKSTDLGSWSSKDLLKHFFGSRKSFRSTKAHRTRSTRSTRTFSSNRTFVTDLAKVFFCGFLDTTTAEFGGFQPVLLTHHSEWTAWPQA